MKQEAVKAGILDSEKQVRDRLYVAVGSIIRIRTRSESLLDDLGPDETHRRKHHRRADSLTTGAGAIGVSAANQFRGAHAPRVLAMAPSRLRTFLLQVLITMISHRWPPARKTKESLNAGKNCRTVVGDTFAISPDAQVDALATSRRLMRTNAQFDLRRKFMMRMGAW
jgi:hypothetical protein